MLTPPREVIKTWDMGAGRRKPQRSCGGHGEGEKDGENVRYFQRTSLPCCDSRRHIWKNNGWKKSNPNGNTRSRTIANAELWKTVDLQLSQNGLVTIAWCKGHSGIAGNERADALADKGRLSLRSA